MASLRLARSGWCPLYDELTLSYPQLVLPLADSHPHPADAQTRWGSVIAGLSDVGIWRRTLTDGRRRAVRLAVAWPRGVTSWQRAAMDAEPDRLAEFLNAEPIREDWDPR